MLSIADISDRLEIEDVVKAYSHAIDRREFDHLRQLFTADAHIDYSAFNGSVGTLEETIEFLKSALTKELFPNCQHLLSNIQIELDGDSASGRVMCFNPMEMSIAQGEKQVFMLGLWYLDEYQRTAGGWRISRREEERSWVFNAPDFMGF
ncbi:MAG: nuclear transport factor 2 family protein [Proteobacteria bacterium]|nr:nuclear transport factor 2 family protein [Pseudomonadota bacterium]